jgi:hypothetical protein
VPQVVEGDVRAAQLIVRAVEDLAQRRVGQRANRPPQRPPDSGVTGRAPVFSLGQVSRQPQEGVRRRRYLLQLLAAFGLQQHHLPPEVELIQPHGQQFVRSRPAADAQGDDRPVPVARQGSEEVVEQLVR